MSHAQENGKKLLLNFENFYLKNYLVDFCNSFFKLLVKTS